MFFSYAAVCDTGRIRTENQDNLYCNGLYRREDGAPFRRGGVFRDTALFAVADGMGGEANGAHAALETVAELDRVDRRGGAEALKAYLLERNEALCREIRRDGGRRMGATFAGLLCADGQAHVVNIGDSRVYLFREGHLEQLSRDHTSIRSMVEMGILTEEAARTHPDRHRLSQHLGIFPEELIIEPYSVTGQPQAGDRFLLCSDGLTDMMENREMEAVLRGSEPLRHLTEQLYRTAMERGGKDNFTVILVQADETLPFT